MAKKEIGPNDAYKNFMEVIDRIEKASIWNNNGALMITNINGAKILVYVDPDLMKLIIQNKELEMTDYDINDPEMNRFGDQFQFTVTGDEWLDLDAEKLYKGESIELNIDGHDIPVIINKDLIPVKLKKAECDQIMYKVTKNKLGIKKRFEILADHGFTMMRLYLIV